jgi:hypothetical protein
MISTPAEPACGGELGRRGGMRRVRVQADDPAPRGDPLGQHVQDPARPAAEIDRTLAWQQADPVQQRRAVGGQFLRLALQPGAFAPAAAQRVDSAGVWAGHARSRPQRFTHATPTRNQYQAVSGITGSHPYTPDLSFLHD